MKPIPILLLLGALTWNARGQATNDWFSIDAGGGQVTNANASIRFTLGQPDASTSVSTNYAIIGGFWALLSTVVPEVPPELAIAHSPPNVRIWWPSPSIGYVLQTNANLLNTNGWGVLSQVPSDDGQIKSVFRPLSEAPRYYRLRKN